jgi:uncharacterized alkaline shock family protein YloU
LKDTNNVLEMNQDYNGLGKVEIAPEVIEVIAGIAASEIEGVASMRGNFAAGVVERLGKKNHGKGVKVELTEEGIVIEVFCVMIFGVSLEVNEVNIHVVGIQFESKTQEVEVDQEM